MPPGVEYYLSQQEGVAKIRAFAAVVSALTVAKVTASWGIDDMLLAKLDDRWKIVQILWQSHPPTTTTSSSR